MAVIYNIIEHIKTKQKKLYKKICIIIIYIHTVGAIIISSLADFVGLPTYKELNCV